MNKLHTTLSASCLAFCLGAGSHWLNAEQEQETKPPYMSPQAKRQAKLEADLQGTWRLLDYQAPDKLFEGQDRLAGWLMVRDGYLSWTAYGSEEVPGLFGNEAQANLEAILYRYRVSLTSELQLASVLGFSDLDETDGLVFDDGHNALDYQLIVDSGSLILTDPGVETFTFRRMREAKFPERAIRALESDTDIEFSDEER